MIPCTPQERYALAARLQLQEQYLYQIFTGRKQAPLERCPPIEHASEGRITCEMLRPDVAWVRVADAVWPHPKGRPLPDVAADLSPKTTAEA